MMSAAEAQKIPQITGEMTADEEDQAPRSTDVVGIGADGAGVRPMVQVKRPMVQEFGAEMIARDLQMVT